MHSSMSAAGRIRGLTWNPQAASVRRTSSCVRKEAPFRGADRIAEHGERSPRRDPRVELAERSRCRVAGIGERGLSLLRPAAVQVAEGLPFHADLPPDLDPLRHGRRPRFRRSGVPHRAGMARGIVGIVRRFSVTSSPTVPSPRVEPTVRRALIRRGGSRRGRRVSAPRYSGWGSSLPRNRRQRRSNSRISSSEKALARLSIGVRWVTARNFSRGGAPTRCVGESGVSKIGEFRFQDRSAPGGEDHSRRRRSPDHPAGSSAGCGGGWLSVSDSIRIRAFGIHRDSLSTRHPDCTGGFQEIIS